jgi:hypothetical protein
MKTNLSKALTATLLSFAALAVRAADVNVQATLSPDSISLGESAVLKVTINGSRSANPTLPQMDGLEFEGAGQSSQFSWNNGNISSNVVLIYRVVPAREGSFTIPPISCQVDGKNMLTQPLTLKVLKAGGNNITNNGVQPQASAATPVAEEKGNALFGRISGVPETMYVGQVIPATISFYLNRRANSQVNQIGMPSLKNDSFSSSTLKPNQIKQREEMINGVPYFVVSADLTLTAIKEGQFELAAQWPISIYVLEGGDNKQKNNDDPFNDPFFRGFFRRKVEKSVTVHSGKHTVDVLPLPQDGKPASFSGAIGKFEITVGADPAEVRVGDPLTLKMAVQGSGNFDRITTPVLLDGKGWKTYPASNHFEPGDSAGIEGVKTFSQALIPQDSQVKTLPNLEFSYFDPQTVHYVTVHPELPKVAVLPAEPDKILAQQTVPAGDSAPIMAPIRLEEGTMRADLRPVTRKAWFWAMQSGPLLLGLAGFFLLRRYRKQVLNPDYQQHRQTDRNIAQSLQALDSALANEDSAAFAEAASRALRERLAGLWRVRAESITTADVRGRLGGEGGGIIALFEAADAVTYAGRRFNRDEMSDFKRRIMEQLNQLGTKS